MVDFCRLWNPLASSEIVEKGVEAAKAVFELAKTLNEEKDNNSQIRQLVAKIPTLLEALNSPMGKIVSSSLPFVNLATGLIQFTIDINKKEPTFHQSTAIVTQAAYLESIKFTLATEPIFQRDQEEASEDVQKQIRELAEKKIQINDYEAKLALVNFPESKLAKEFNEVLSVRLKDTRVPDKEVDIFVKKVAINTAWYIDEVLAEGGDGVQRLRDWCGSKGRDTFSQHESIKNYLTEQIEPLPSQKVFQEAFSLEQIYVPLKATILDENGNKTTPPHNEILEEWVQKNILDPEKKGQVIFIQAAPGRGKSVFCRMFAHWVKQNLHPILTPILIQLRDIENFQQIFDRTLSDFLTNYDFVSSDRGWLTDHKTQYLFLLDGFDELRIDGRTHNIIERFIQQVEKFQEKNTSGERRHRVIVTGRPLLLQDINYPSTNLERVELLPMDDNLQAQWLDKWKQVVISENPDTAEEEITQFKKFLINNHCPREIKDELAREPLLLYLLAKLHKKKEIGVDDFQQTQDSTQAKILIYQKCLDLVLRKQRDALLQDQITGLHIDSLEYVSIEAGLCVVQSGGEYTTLKMIETRLESDHSDVASKIKNLRNERGEKALTSALGAFYMGAAGGGGGVEFYHKSFSDFLCAKRLQASLEEWTIPGPGHREWLINDQNLAEQIYDLFGYGALNIDIVEYLRGLLINSQEKFKPVELFERLQNFYQHWCQGKFIDQKGTTLPQQKMRELQEQLPKKVNLGQREVDIYTGLNVMILLLELHRYGQQKSELKEKINFHPCRQNTDQGQLEDNTRLVRIMDLSSCLGNNGFLQTVGPFLKKANLSNVDLSRANLSKVDLSGADLSGAILRQADLTEANLDGANLSDTDMCRCDLTRSSLQNAILKSSYLRGSDCRDAKFNYADLESADFCRAYLYKTDFANARFSNVSVKKANLDSANLKDADFDNLSWDVGTNWFHARGIDKIKNVPQNLENNVDFKAAKSLSIGFEKLDSGEVLEALKICRKIAQEVSDQRGEVNFKAQIYNRFAWLSCLFNKEKICTNEIADIAHQAVTLDPQRGNYQDTYALALVMNTKSDLYMPHPNAISDDEYRDRDNSYNEAIKLFKEALRSEDFQKLALPNRQKIRQRREDWIQKLEKRINPFTAEMMSLLLQEEY